MVFYRATISPGHIAADALAVLLEKLDIVRWLMRDFDRATA